MEVGKLTGVWRYPVKSMAAEAAALQAKPAGRAIRRQPVPRGRLAGSHPTDRRDANARRSP